MFGGKWSFLLTLNGVLGGMVAQCAGCNNYLPWAAAVVGALGGIAYFVVHILMVKVGPIEYDLNFLNSDRVGTTKEWE